MKIEIFRHYDGWFTTNLPQECENKLRYVQDAIDRNAIRTATDELRAVKLSN